ncbi:MAG: hypothetical protein AB7T06_27890 [Kofleriaceae bacterium]
MRAGDASESKVVMAARIPAAARRLLDGPIDSLEKLEILAALRRRPLGIAGLVVQLLIPRGVVKQSVWVVVDRGLHRRRTDDVIELVADPRVVELLALYDADRLSVITTISRLSIERIRGMTARAFANAFVLRKKGEDDDG